MIKTLLEIVRDFFSDWKWDGLTGHQGSIGCTGYTGISLDEWNELINNKEK